MTHMKEFEPNFASRRKIVGVMGGAGSYPDLTGPLGRLIARMGYHLLTGAGGGVMAEVSEAFYRLQGRQGLVLGIVRAKDALDPRPAVFPRSYEPNKLNSWVELPIYTHLHKSGKEGRTLESRNHINVLTSDVVVVLPGDHGTESELELALQYGTPVVFFLSNGGAMGKVNKNQPAHYSGMYPKSLVTVATSIVQVQAALQGYLPET
jgi:predicted Rossmann-fold nucleotide-binding protein